MFKNLQMNRYGLIGFVLIIAMIVIRMLQIQVPANVTENLLLYRIVAVGTDFYVLLSIISFLAVNMLASRRLNSRRYTQQRLSANERLTWQNVYIGSHIALFLLIIGLLLGLPNIIWQIGFYIIAVAVGLFIPFQLLARRDNMPNDKKDELEF